jgi:hypothetical protein
MKRLFFLLVWAQIMILDAQAQLFMVKGRTYPVGPNPCAIACADLNGDDYLDIVTTDRGILTDTREQRPANDELSILLGGADLGFEKLHPSLKTDFGPYAVVLANIDAMKWPDIIVASFHATRGHPVSLFLNLKPEGIFRPYEFAVPLDKLDYARHRDGDNQPIFTLPGITALAVQDLNGDGLRDLVATAWSCDSIFVFSGHAETYFAAPVHFAAPGGPRDLVLADFNADNATDMAVAMYATGEIALWRGNPKGEFTPAGRFPTRGRLPVAIATADFDGDGRRDLAVAHGHADDSIVVFYGDGNFGFSISQEILLAPERERIEAEIRDLVAEDVSGDGRADLVAACHASREVAVCVNQEAAGGLPRFAIERYTFPEGRPRAICTGDFDRNGSKDLAVALWDVNAVGLMIRR